MGDSIRGHSHRFAFRHSWYKKMDRTVIVGLWGAVILAMLVLGEEPSTVPVEQHVPSDCLRGERDCPDYFPSTWKTYQAACCSALTGPVFHCQEQTDDEASGAPAHLVVACVYPVTCQAGTYAFIHTWTEGGLNYSRIDCRPCSADRFQPYPTDSYKCRNPRCTRERQRCQKEEGLLEVQKGNASHDDLCRCWWEGGYRPDNDRPQCTSLKGFAQDDTCICVPSDCHDGRNLNHEFRCVEVPSTTTTNIPAEAAGDAAIRKTDVFMIAIATFVSTSSATML